MANLEMAFEWLRSILMASQTWDYCVLWKLSSEVSRSIEWTNCCCVGGCVGHSCLNNPNGEDEQGFLGSAALCRDSFNPHLANKKSCLALAQLPFFISLESGIYEQVIVSSQPKWINLPDKALHETVGTRVLIPVLGGLVELFAAEQILEDQEIMEFVAAPFNDSQKIDSFPSLNWKDDTFTEDSWMHYFQESDCKPLMLDLLSGQFDDHPKLEGSSSGSIPLCLGLGNLYENSSPKQKLEGCSPLGSTKNNKAELNSGCDTSATGGEISNVSHRDDRQEVSQKEEKQHHFKSKNLIIERKRRARIKRGLCDLRALVPKISNMNQAATLDDAADHIVEMKKVVKDLQKELEELESDECNNVTESQPSVSNWTVLDANRNSTDSNRTQMTKVVKTAHVEVNRLNRRDFLIKILCKAKAGACTGVLETLEYLGLQVTEVNVTSCKGITSNSFVVQVNNGDIQTGKLRDMLIKHACG